MERRRDDIRTEADTRAVVDAFYHGIEEDPVIGHHFAGIDMSHHLPKMYTFWSSVVFQTATYRGRPFDVHLQLGALAPEHFTRWLERFSATVDRLYAGDHAEHMKRKAYQIGTIFQIKMELEPATIPPAANKTDFRTR